MSEYLNLSFNLYQNQMKLVCTLILLFRKCVGFEGKKGLTIIYFATHILLQYISRAHNALIDDNFSV